MQRSVLILIPTILFVPVLVAQSVPTTINYQGRLTDNTPQQNPLNTTVPMRFAVWDAASNGTQLWQEPASGGTNVPVINGIFNIALGGNGVPLPALIFTGVNSTRYLEITLNPGAGNQEILSPRQVIGSQGYAAVAENANRASDSASLAGTAAAGWQKAVIAACPANQFYSAIAQSGAGTCGSPVLTPPVTLNGSLANPAAILNVSNNGTGPGIWATSTDGPGILAIADQYVGILGQSSVNSPGGMFINDDPASGTFSLIAHSATNNGENFIAYTEGQGAAGTFIITNPANGSASVNALSFGSGPAGLFSANNSYTALLAGNGGTGSVAQFSLSNAASTNDSVQATTRGTGAAVQGWHQSVSGTGTGLRGRTGSPQGVGVSAEGSGSGGTALSISGGSIKVAGAGAGTPTPAFIHAVAPANLCGAARTILDNPYANGDPAAILLITPLQSGQYHIVYDAAGTCLSERWLIVRDDSALSGIERFNLMIIKP